MGEREKIRTVKRMEFDYEKESGESSRRDIRPTSHNISESGNEYIKGVDHDTDDEFRSFRKDRMSNIRTRKR